MDGPFLTSGLFKLIRGEESCLSSSVSDDNAPLFGRLDVGLEVATDPISNRYKAEFDVVEHVTMLCGQFQQTLCETVVVLLLLHSVVQGRVAEVLLSISNEESFELWKVLPTEAKGEQQE